MFFQHRSHITPAPSICIHRPSSIVFSHFMHTRVFLAFSVARRCVPAPSAPAPPEPCGWRDSGRLLAGLVFARAGSFGRLMLSLWSPPSPGTSGSANIAGLDTDDVVGDVGSSSSSVSMARSSPMGCFNVNRLAV
jgi:hypothetical protein